mmetsp:Transcript_17462/g.43959  ORF Transcript_17462/g.43959 Transcript_17462/m.43959 type:complete len:228 (-) Transcript_17462:56-739(-)
MGPGLRLCPGHGSPYMISTSAPVQPAGRQLQAWHPRLPACSPSCTPGRRLRASPRLAPAALRQSALEEVVEHLVQPTVLGVGVQRLHAAAVARVEVAKARHVPVVQVVQRQQPRVGRLPAARVRRRPAALHPKQARVVGQRPEVARQPPRLRAAACCAVRPTHDHGWLPRPLLLPAAHGSWALHPHALPLRHAHACTHHACGRHAPHHGVIAAHAGAWHPGHARHPW